MISTFLYLLFAFTPCSATSRQCDGTTEADGCSCPIGSGVKFCPNIFGSKKCVCTGDLTS
jgi:hypothetical protein